MSKFKAGDKVYYPPKSTKVLTVYELDDSVYPILVDLGSRHTHTFTIDGKFYTDDALSSIFHATPEMKAKLEDLHGVEFEAPPVKPTSREVIQAKLNKSTEPVPCWVNNNSDRTQPTRKDVWAFVKEVDTDPSSKFPYLDATGNWWMHATPFDHTTFQPITELPE